MKHTNTRSRSLRLCIVCVALLPSILYAPPVGGVKDEFLADKSPAAVTFRKKCERARLLEYLLEPMPKELDPEKVRAAIVELYEEAVAAMPSAPPAPQVLCRCGRWLSTTSFGAKEEPDRAAHYYRRVLDEYARDPRAVIDAYTGLANCAIIKKQYKAAADYFQKIADLELPENTDTRSAQYVSAAKERAGRNVGKWRQAAANVRQDTPVHGAAWAGDCETIARLLRDGADIDAKDPGGYTPLLRAASRLHTDAIALLLEHGANVNATNDVGQTAIFMVARHGGLEIVKLLVAHGADIPKEGYTPLNEAAGGGFLSSAGAEQRREALVSLFLDHGVDVNARGSCAFSFGKNGGCTPLHAAAGRAGTNVIQLLLDRGAELDARDPRQSTPLHHAALASNADAASVLVANGANVNATNYFGCTPLHTAISINNVRGRDRDPVVKILLRAGADVNVQSKRGLTPLHEAVQACLDPKTARGDAPGIVKMLLDAGADIHTKDRYGRTALSFAERIPEIRDMLMKHLKERDRQPSPEDH